MCSVVSPLHSYCIGTVCRERALARDPRQQAPETSSEDDEEMPNGYVSLTALCCDGGEENHSVAHYVFFATR